MKTCQDFAVVPARDEQAHIARVIATTPASVSAIVIVDDGSTDFTIEAAVSTNDPRVTVLSRSPARGAGDAVVTGFVTRSITVRMSCACSPATAKRTPTTLRRSLRRLRQIKPISSKAIGSPGRTIFWSMPLERHLAVLTLGRLTRWASGYPIVDSQSGYIAITRKTLLALPLERLWHSYGYPNDLILRLSEIGARVAHVPVRPCVRGAGEPAFGVACTKIVEIIARGAIRKYSSAHNCS